MNIDNVSPSILHVTANDHLDVSADLNASQNKTIAQLIDDKEKNQEENSNPKSSG